MKRNHVWVVELLYKGKWGACVGIGLTKSNAIEVMQSEWSLQMPDDKFRVRKYESPTNGKEKKDE
jgi:hypothetical protein